MAKKPLISIIGRPNVGKSTLINRLAGRRICIVDDQPGVTRDRRYIDLAWEGHEMTLVDTGGLVFSEKEDFSDEILKQASKSLEVSDAVILITDVTAGITKLDYEVAEFLRNYKIPVYVAVNKVDNQKREENAYEFYELGFEKVYPISALHGSSGLGDMLSDLVKELNLEPSSSEIDDEIIRVSFAGKPNVGKSSLFNKLVGEERSIVSDISGTTRDAIDTRLKRHGQTFELIDTAGLRRKAKVDRGIEKYSNLRTIDSIEKSDVVVLLIDGAAQEIDKDDITTDQDKKIISLIADRGKATVVLVNKWDLVKGKDDPKFLKFYKERLGEELHFISYASKEYISAISGQRTDNLWEMITSAYEQYTRRIPTGTLNKVLSDITLMNPPPLVGQKALKIKYITQAGVKPPTFILFVNDAKLVQETYERYLVRQLREYFGFEGTPIRLRFKSQTD